MSMFSERLRALRAEKGILQADVCEALCIKPQSYSTYENGREPNYDLLIRLAKYFNCTPDYLLGISDYKNIEEKEKTERQINAFLNSIDNLPLQEKQNFYDLFYEISNNYNSLVNFSNYKKTYLKCLKSISSEISKSSAYFLMPLKEIQKTYNGSIATLLRDMRSSEIKCNKEIQKLYSAIEEYLIIMEVEEYIDAP